MTQRFDRRRFLLGSTGSLLAMPLLESLMPRSAFANVVAPKRLLVFSNHHGRIIGTGLKANGVVQDLWSPAAATGPLPAGVSPLLAALDPIRSEIVTVDCVDNVVRHAGAGTSGPDGHFYPSRTCMTCVLPKADGSGGGPSIDFVAGQRLRANAAMPASIVVSADSGNFASTDAYWGAGGTSANLVNATGSPTDAINAIFGNVMPSMPPPTPSLRDRLAAKRTKVLDDVLQDYTAVRAKVSVRDQSRLDQHMQFLRDTQAKYAAMGGSTPAAMCTPVLASSVPAKAEAYSYSAANDDLTVPIIIEAIAQGLACDVARSFVCDFSSDVPTFDFLFPGGTPFTTDVWHAQVHGSGGLTDPSAANTKPTIGFYASMFAKLVQRLASITDVDGARLLDNTLVLWTSDLGYGATHGCFNYPVIFAGMKGAFARGQGRHLVPASRASLGDVYAAALRMLGGTDMTFGATGTLKTYAGTSTLGCDNTNFCSDYGFPGHITPDTPLHSGPLDL